MLSTAFYVGAALLLLGTVLPLVRIGGDGVMRRIALFFSMLALLVFISFSVFILYTNQQVYLAPYGIAPGLVLSFRIDRLAAFFILLISVVALSASIYSVQYIGHWHGEKRKNILTGLMNLFIAAMLFVVSSANMFAFLFFWEIMSMSSFALVLFEYEKPETRKAGLFYFIMTQLSTLFLTAGFLGLNAVTGSFAIQPADIGTGAAGVVFLALFVGFGIKAGVIPFHKWLPYAHTASPSNISALMSGVMIKVAIYGLMRFTLTVLQPETWWGVLILVAGTLSAILGVIYALKEHDIKRLLAYHSIENIGIILIGFGAYIIFTNNNLPDIAMLCLLGSLFHVLNHAVFKSLLFLTAGSVVYRTGERNIEDMGGLVKRMPYTALFFLVGAVSISGLPPFNGFVSELMIFTALLQSYALVDPFMKVLMLSSLAILALTSALASACFVKAFGITFLAAPRSDNAKNAKEVGKYMLLGPMILAFLCMSLGIFSYQIFAGAGYVLPIPDLLLIGSFLAAAYVLAWFVLKNVSSSAERMGETWGCGILTQTGRNEYTASGYSQPIVRIFSSIYRTKEVREATYFDESKSLFVQGSAEIHLVKFFEEALYLPIARLVNSLSEKVSRLQNWNLDTYLAYVFIAAVLIMVYVGWFI